MAAARGQMMTNCRLRKVKRYWPGRVPEWAAADYDDEDIEEVGAGRKGQDHRRRAHGGRRHRLY
jgi:hypothetical protein